MTYVPDLGKISMFAMLFLSGNATKLSNIWPRDTSIPIFSRGGFSLLTKNLSMSTVQSMNTWKFLRAVPAHAFV